MLILLQGSWIVEVLLIFEEKGLMLLKILEVAPVSVFRFQEPVLRSWMEQDLNYVI